MTEINESPELSVVAPMYNEEGNILAFVAAVEKVIRSIGVPFEIILVDDGSSDGTWAQIVEQSKHFPALRGARLARNFGHQGALMAGLSEARGRAIVSMDGDLQHPPELIPELFARWREGYKVVATERADAEDTSLFKRATSRWFYAVFSKLTGVSMAPGNSDFRLLDASAVKALCEMRDADLFIRGSVTWLGFRSITLPYRANKRFSGTTKYSLKKMLRFASGAILSFSLVPLRFGIWIGFLTSGLAVVELGYILYAYFSGKTVTGWSSMMAFMSLMFGILFVLLGVIGTYLGKIFEVLKNRPRFLIGERSP
ncbi:MAG TPA: glycosyltransferase family 2 protein [Polyangiaceae bacterium]|jgi:glycosyltransferase involved in cell wall biosynthesis|nr:glycosyltransferase family 2 protein [Polyangiaceae bacterium]